MNELFDVSPKYFSCQFRGVPRAEFFRILVEVLYSSFYSDEVKSLVARTFLDIKVHFGTLKTSNLNGVK